MQSSWRTTGFGIATIVAALAGAAKAFLDGDPMTNPDWTTLIAALTAGVGLIKAKDHSVKE